MSFNVERPPLSPKKEGEASARERGPKSNKLPPELWPYKEEMENWLRENLNQLYSFFQYKHDRAFQLVCGDAFYYQPDQNIISLSVPFFKDYKEKGIMTIDQIMFVFLHEMAHYKTMVEEDLAGKQNMLKQFSYERSKTMKKQVNGEEKVVALGGHYRQFYNIMEDMIVNHMVSNTMTYAKSSGTEGARRHNEVRQLYTDVAFVQYREVAPGETGDYHKGPGGEFVEALNDSSAKWKKLNPDDYLGQVDFEKLEPGKKQLGSQFFYFFVKQQMLGLSAASIASPENPNGKYHLSPLVEQIFTKPIASVYQNLLTAIFEKYQGNPEKMQELIAFMTTGIAVPEYEKKDGKTRKKEPIPVYYNVFSSYAGDPQFAVKKGTMIYTALCDNFLRKLNLTSLNVQTAGFLDIFEQFKKFKKGTPGASPLAFNLNERTKIIRQLLEPIYTMISILDDSFDVNVNDLPSSENGEGGGSGGSGKSPEGAKENKEKPDWKVNDVVYENLNVNGRPRRGRKGVITKINKGSDGQIISVEVEWFLDPGMSFADQAKQSGKNILSAEIDVFYNPDKELILSDTSDSDEQNENTKSSVKDKRYRHKENEASREKKDKKDNEDNEDKDEQDQEQNQEDEQNDQSEQGEAGEADTDVSESEAEQNLTDAMSSMEKALRKMIADDQREERGKELDKQRNSNEYKERASLNELKDRLKQANIQLPEGQTLDSLLNSYRQQLEKVRPYADEMAKAWMEILQQVTDQIRVEKEKYFMRYGNLDVERVQEYWEELQMGEDIRYKPVFEQWVEKIIAEFKPRLLRLTLLVDNSGSMSDHVDTVRQLVLLLDQSLRSLSLLFGETMKEVLGPNYRSDVNIACDLSIGLFGDTGRIIKNFAIKDLSFLKSKETTAPSLNFAQIELDILKFYAVFNPNEGTEDEQIWHDILADRQRPEIREYYEKKLMTEIIFQISDGAISGDGFAGINGLRALGVSTGGLSIGGPTSLAALSQRHGEYTESGDDTATLVRKFGPFLKRLVSEKIFQPMVEEILNSNK